MTTTTSVLTITLHQTLEQAQASKRLIDNDACGHACRNDHEIVSLRP